jgi:tetratricopeptide (TPR) repeat protein
MARLEVGPMNLLIAASVLALASPGHDPGHDHAPQLGKVTFETSCSAAADAQVRRGLAWLHSFEYQRAERSFAEAAAADPGCGIASWGVAMTYYHPLWAAPTPDEFHKGRAALVKAREAGAKSQRERDYIAALGTFYDGDADHKARVLAYQAAMEQLHQRYPDDREATVFDALALIAAGTLDSDPTYARERRAGEMLNVVLKQEPNHPGVAHYLIHSFDYPALAEFALPAARRYASIAPDSAHAQHMPSHIFTRLGLWDESIRSNRAAEAAARAWAATSGMSGAWDQQLHAMDYLAYAYLQSGRDADAQAVLHELSKIHASNPTPTTAYAVTSIPARVLLERRRWAEAAAFELPESLARIEALSRHKWGEANVRFANAIGAARGGDLPRAKAALARLGEIEASLVVAPGEYDWRTQVSIERQIAEAWLAFAEGRKDDALRIMRAAADLDDATEKHPVTPGAVLPAREQLGELLLELGRPAQALSEFEASLKRAPKRLGGLYGAARSARLAGNQDMAKRYFAELAQVTEGSDGSRSEVMEARTFASQTAAR